MERSKVIKNPGLTATGFFDTINITKKKSAALRAAERNEQ